MSAETNLRRDFLRLAGACLTAGAFALKATAGSFDVKTFGATGDGKTLDTAAINKAIEAAAAAGGGTVVFPARQLSPATRFI